MAQLRDRRTGSDTFRQLISEVSGLLAYEALRDLGTEAVTVDTPVADAAPARRVAEVVLLVPILRAGLGMVQAIQEIVPLTEVAHVGLRRDEATLRSEVYLNRLPRDLSGPPRHRVRPHARHRRLARSGLRPGAPSAGPSEMIALCSWPRSLAWPLSGPPTPACPCTAPRWTRSSTTRGTSCLGWATPGTASSGRRTDPHPTRDGPNLALLQRVQVDPDFGRHRTEALSRLRIDAASYLEDGP